jgi:hypothetical protein
MLLHLLLSRPLRLMLQLPRLLQAAVLPLLLLLPSGPLLPLPLLRPLLLLVLLPVPLWPVLIATTLAAEQAVWFNSLLPVPLLL